MTDQKLEDGQDFIPSSELRKMKTVPSTWVVEGLLRTGRKRPSILAGKPESGKSTLAKQLAVAVAQGADFLDRKTMRGEVILWQTEDDDIDIKHQLTALGNKDGDEEIHVFVGDPDMSGMEGIVSCLKEHPKVRLVIIETLDDLLKMRGINDNTAGREAFAEFTTKLSNPFNDHVAFLAIHHLKKSEVQFGGDGLLGNTQIRGRSDNKIFIQQMTPDDETRMVWSTKRGGTAIPKTLLEFDPVTGKATLGQTVAEAKMSAEEAERKKELDKVLSFIAQHPDCTQAQVFDQLSGSKNRKVEFMNDLLSTGTVTRTGRGVKGHPYLYRSNLPVEEAGKSQALPEEQPINEEVIVQ